MKFKEITISIESNDLPASVEFYTNRLGFKVLSLYPEHAPAWMMLESDSVKLMITERNSHSGARDTGFTGNFYFYCEQVEELWQQFQHSGIPIEYPLEKFDYGMLEFGVYDPNGYLLRFGKTLDEDGQDLEN